MKTKTTSIIAAVIGTLFAAYAAFVYFWQAPALIMAVGYPIQIDERYIWWPFCAAVILWTCAGYGFISRRKHGHDHAA